MAFEGKRAKMVCKGGEVHSETLIIDTPGPGLHEISREVADLVSRSGVTEGLCSLFIQHTSASLVIQENADPSASRDLEEWFGRIAPENHSSYTHTAEGPDDMPSHLRSAVTQTSEQIPVAGGRLALGTWQGIFLFEHRRLPHRRKIIARVWS